MKKKIFAALLVMAAVIGMAFAANERNWCATAKCFSCKAVYHDTVGAKTKSEAITEAKKMVDHESFCKAKKGSRIKAVAAVGSCPQPPKSEYDGE